ncbi:MAG: PIN domain-containing protein [Nitrospira sp.]|nr:PIN domain-containing protein [Nitrospira sp.]MDH4303046.1 PIN domain-containing protein [Nitrospira sp.]MDH5192085.1 PIN domain-containing protein [Nitrospira sp.]
MPLPVLLDTGPLVAFLNRRDRYHQWAVAQWASLKPPFLTCEAVLAESCYLLRRSVGGSQAVMQLLIRGVVTVPFHLDEEMPAVAKLLFRYASVPMSLADACLVSMAERYPSGIVMTLDDDFRVYRKHGRQAIPTRMPAGL